MERTPPTSTRALSRAESMGLAFGGLLLALVSGVVLSGVALGLAAYWYGDPELARDPLLILERLPGALGLAVVVLPIQLAFGLVAVLGARFHRRGWAAGLGLGHSRLDALTVGLLVMGVPAVQLIGLLLVNLLPLAPGESVAKLHTVLGELEGAAVLAGALVAVCAPALGEELFFRGFLQRRLAVGLPGFLAVLLTAGLFAAIHGDPMQSLAVLPLGIWLGWLSWRADCMWPAVLGHALHNAVAFGMALSLGGAPVVEDAAYDELLVLPKAVLLLWGLSLFAGWKGLARFRRLG